MSEPVNSATESAADAQGERKRGLERIPLAVRMVVYFVAFLGGVLVGLPWLAYRVDVYLPSWHFDIGWGWVVGVLLFVAFFVAYVWSSYLLSHRGRGAYVEFDPPKDFVATGPFQWCRNPIAGSLIGMILGEALMFSSTGILLLFCVGLPLGHLQVILLEEPLLRKRFGQAYEDYLKHVPRWLPRWKPEALRARAQTEQAREQERE